MKALSLRIKQAIIILLFISCVIFGIVLLFGEQTRGFDVLLFILIKIIGIGFVVASYVIYKVSFPSLLSLLEDEYEVKD